MIAYCDLAGLVRGRSVPAATFDDRLKAGVGWVPANQAICCFGPLAEPNPWGSVGDRRLIPDPATRVRVDLWDDATPLDFALSDAVHTDGAPWDACPRTFLRRALDELRAETGLRLMASFEHEFVLGGDVGGGPFTLAAQRVAEPFAGDVWPRSRRPRRRSRDDPARVRHRASGRCWCGPPRASPPPTAPRSSARSCARWRAGSAARATFSPLPDPDGIGNGVHVHISLRRRRRPQRALRRRPARRAVRRSAAPSPPACCGTCRRCWRSRPRARSRSCASRRTTGAPARPRSATATASARCASAPWPRSPAATCRASSTWSTARWTRTASPHLGAGAAGAGRRGRASGPGWRRRCCSTATRTSSRPDELAAFGARPLPADLEPALARRRGRRVPARLAARRAVGLLPLAEARPSSPRWRDCTPAEACARYAAVL